MSDEAARRCVLRVLADPAISRISFHIGSVRITPHLLRRVRTCVSGRRIPVRHDLSLPCNEYDSVSNTLYLLYDHTTHFTQEASIVHECVHAGLDLARASRMRTTSSEAAGYIGQCIYASIKNPHPDERLMGSTPSRDRVFEIAWRLAGSILAGHNPTNANLNALRLAISRHPFYRDERGLAGYNGVP